VNFQKTGRKVTEKELQIRQISRASTVRIVTEEYHAASAFCDTAFDAGVLHDDSPFYTRRDN
jgi:hypothetical protein